MSEIISRDVDYYGVDLVGATEQLDFDAQYLSVELTGQAEELAIEALLFDPYGGIGISRAVRNKAWQTTGTPGWVYWTTEEPDSTGASFPGPGVFGTCTDYRVEHITYVEEN